MSTHAVTLAGRRIDAPFSSTPRFPLRNVGAVRERLAYFFATRQVAYIVCSAACGADLIALDLAKSMSIEATVVLPFSIERFRRTSVIDRPGEWEALFFSSVNYANKSGGLIIIESKDTLSDEDAYHRVTERFFVELRSKTSPKIAVAVWEGSPRGKTDATKDFIDTATAENLQIETISTVE